MIFNMINSKMNNTDLAVKYIISKYDTMKTDDKDNIEFNIGKTPFTLSEVNDEINIKYISMHNVEINYICPNISYLEEFLKTIFV